MNIFIGYPKGLVSSIQELQMTTIPDKNVHTLSFQVNPETGSDDLDPVAKVLFDDVEFKKKYNLSTINSPNICRIVFNLAHYFYLYLKLLPQCDKAIYFSVPTGAFGNSFTAYLAKKMGLPIERILIGNSENAILHRFITTGIYEKSAYIKTHSPALDSTTPYNFERLLYYLSEGDSTFVREKIAEFAESGKMSIPQEYHFKAVQSFLSDTVCNMDTFSTIAKVHYQFGYYLDTHTAVGVRTAWNLRDRHRSYGFSSHKDIPVVCLATAAPYKFKEIVEKATSTKLSPPKIIEALQNQSKRYVTDVPASADKVSFLRNLIISQNQPSKL